MRVLYTHEQQPFTREEIESCMFGLEDEITVINKYEIPYFGTDPQVPLRYDEFDAYDAASLAEVVQTEFNNLSLGQLLIVDKKLILSVDPSWSSSPEDIDQFIVWGIATPYLVIMVSTYDLTKAQQLIVLKHEFGHFYGLPHCNNICIMSVIEGVSKENLDLIPLDLCTECIQQLQVIIKI